MNLPFPRPDPLNPLRVLPSSLNANNLELHPTIRLDQIFEKGTTNVKALLENNGFEDSPTNRKIVEIFLRTFLTTI